MGYVLQFGEITQKNFIIIIIYSFPRVSPSEMRHFCQLYRLGEVYNYIEMWFLLLTVVDLVAFAV